METAELERERFHLYSREEIRKVFDDEDITEEEDFSYLTAVGLYTLLLEVEGEEEAAVGFQPSKDIRVVESYMHPTGYFFVPGQPPVAVINEDSILDYDLVSQLHPIQDADVYLWLGYPYIAADKPLALYKEWYRRDVYKDGFEKFNGVLGNPDLPDKMGADNDD